MSRLSWSGTTERYFETGLDRGVFYSKETESDPAQAVAWNGLISVDEDGADSASEYYIDGRPFLFVPKAKEFSATLTAYTYPDEFAQAMGLVEATDGMYLDSQQGTSFDFSYRTLIGSDAQNTKAGYKIHLIYNVTAANQGVTYETLSDTVSPSDFSWEIKAVPVPIEGFRSTAHVVIDTRHIDTTRLSELEDLLYGTTSAAAHMPDPSDILELLDFGDAIIITVGLNGTWTASGSYHNVHLLSAGIFQIDNVNAVGHGDGTYDISSTP